MKVFGAGIIGLFLLTAAAAAQQQADWPVYGGDAGGARYSTAEQITPTNVTNLDIAWQIRHGDLPGSGDDKGFALEVTPILTDRSLVFCTPYNQVVAVDPGTGEEHWRFDPNIDRRYFKSNQYVCRGVAQWRDKNVQDDAVCAHRILTNTNDLELIALDARTGAVCPEFGDGGRVALKPDRESLYPGEYHITSAPTIIGDIVVVGSAIGDNSRAQAQSGVVRAFHIRDGAPAWQFDPTPRQDGVATGQANSWTTMSADEKRDLLFFVTGSASPDFFGGLRPGDDEYANSVIAVRGITGALIWHFQTVHHDLWDYDLPAQPTLATLPDGRDVVIVAAKTGFVFVFERETGKPVFEIVETAVPASDVPGEFAAPTQPIPSAPPALVPQNLSPDDAWGLTFWDRNKCRDWIAKLRHDGMFTPPSLGDGTLLMPGTGGGVNWGGGAFDPTSGVYVVNTNRFAHAIRLFTKKAPPPNEYRSYEVGKQAGTPYGVVREILLSPIGLPCNPPPYGVLSAVDMTSGKILWESTLGTTEDLAPFGLALKTGTPAFGGPVITASGIVFIAAAMDNYLRAFDLTSGKELWKGRLPAGGQATPMTYVWEGRQYVVIAAGGHSRAGTQPGDYIVAFSLSKNMKRK